MHASECEFHLSCTIWLEIVLNVLATIQCSIVSVCRNVIEKFQDACRS